MTIAEQLLAEFEQESKVTRVHLEAAPEDRFAWKPHDKSMSLAQLGGHIAEAACWAEWMAEPELDFAGLDWKPFVPETKAQLLERFDRDVRVMRDQFAGRDDAFMDDEWTMRAGDKVFINEPRHAVVRNMVLSHTIHHRGQLTVYLRLLGVPVPTAYGPTADFQMS